MVGKTSRELLDNWPQLSIIMKVLPCSLVFLINEDFVVVVQYVSFLLYLRTIEMPGECILFR